MFVSRCGVALFGFVWLTVNCLFSCIALVDARASEIAEALCAVDCFFVYCCVAFADGAHRALCM